MRSIRTELTTKLLAGILLLVGLGAFGLNVALGRVITSQYDQVSLSAARSLIMLIELNEEGVVEFDLEERELPSEGEDAEYFQAWLNDKTLLGRSASLVSHDLPMKALSESETVYWDLVLPSGQAGRAVAVGFRPRLDLDPDEDPDQLVPVVKPGEVSPATLVLARSREDLDQTLGSILLGIAGMGLLLAIGVLLIVRFVVARSLSPMERIASQISRIHPSDLAHRFPSRDLPVELLPIVDRLNELLGRLGAAFERERRFNADVAHELRTPISELRTMAEVGLATLPEGSEVVTRRFKGFLNDALEVALQMEKLVETLLGLALCRAKSQTTSKEPFDLSSVIRDSWKIHDNAARERDLSCRFKLPEKAQVLSDRALIVSILTTLFANAVDHTPRGGALQCQAQAGNGSFKVSLANTNRHLVDEDLGHLFEPFWQKDAARSNPLNSGLGLSMAAAYAELLGARLEADLPQPDLFRVTLEVDAVGH